jgi:hypothetical protein
MVGQEAQYKSNGLMQRLKIYGVDTFPEAKRFVAKRDMVNALSECTCVSALSTPADPLLVIAYPRGQEDRACDAQHGIHASKNSIDGCLHPMDERRERLEINLSTVGVNRISQRNADNVDAARPRSIPTLQPLEMVVIEGACVNSNALEASKQRITHSGHFRSKGL